MSHLFCQEGVDFDFGHDEGDDGGLVARHAGVEAAVGADVAEPAVRVLHGKPLLAQPPHLTAHSSWVTDCGELTERELGQFHG